LTDIKLLEDLVNLIKNPQTGTISQSNLRQVLKGIMNLDVNTKDK